jgi:hypothetical protein
MEYIIKKYRDSIDSELQRWFGMDSCFVVY